MSSIQMQALTYIVQTDMFLADLLLGFKARTVILHRDIFLPP